MPRNFRENALDRRRRISRGWEPEGMGWVRVEGHTVGSGSEDKTMSETKQGQASGVYICRGEPLNQSTLGRHTRMAQAVAPRDPGSAPEAVPAEGVASDRRRSAPASDGVMCCRGELLNQPNGDQRAGMAAVGDAASSRRQIPKGQPSLCLYKGEPLGDPNAAFTWFNLSTPAGQLRKAVLSVETGSVLPPRRGDRREE